MTDLYGSKLAQSNSAEKSKWRSNNINNSGKLTKRRAKGIY